ncbi:universal stress protein [Roseovarius indicus]|uniref:Universal stress protein UspA n=1 Tax=Roseovarius indicus TaxID=540747 RepID=A0A0T5P7I8_9RHOB|nr:universal stress protein [Roseovarius indicus]KRS17052.1 universal stress protein UspA [Roseovarius indicus]QEW29726.1 Universal stress protein family protein [Roseovarius indicus]SFE44450.1 Nucleotide-binding universal stress protein, UspA family [Roseovarius indicus]
MYAKILLCYDGSREGRLALREGARLAQITGADAILLAVVETGAGNALAQGADAGALAHQQADFEEILDEGHQRLSALGLAPKVRMEFGDPVAKITQVATEIGADLVVVGHHQQGIWTRWMSRSVAAGLGDSLKCSLLLAQKLVEDSELFGNG